MAEGIEGRPDHEAQLNAELQAAANRWRDLKTATIMGGDIQGLIEALSLDDLRYMALEVVLNETQLERAEVWMFRREGGVPDVLPPEEES